MPAFSGNYFMVQALKGSCEQIPKNYVGQRFCYYVLTGKCGKR